MFNFKYETRYGDFRDFDTIKMGSVLDIIQDVSTKNSAHLGYGILKLKEMNKAWLLKGMNVHFEKKVSTLCPVDVYTAVKEPKGATSQRGCILKQNGEIVAKSIADWFLFDNEKMRPVRIPEEIKKIYEIYDFEDDFFEYRKPEIIIDAKIKYSIRVSNKDIDTNKHLNNQRGADLMMDALPYDFEFNNISILYKKSTYLGDELDVCVEKLENGYYVHMQDKDENLCVVGRFENL